ncbi:MAG: 50S ribosomal protein L5 [Chloroflexi bacterium]|nr:50S ribosomal protein L5 [Chloroflexota bacterium]
MSGSDRVTTEEQNQNEEQGSQEAASEEKPPTTRRRATRSQASADTKAEGEAQPTTSRRRRASQPKAEQEAGEAQKKEVVTPRPTQRVLEKLRTEVGPVMMQEFSYTSPMQIPRLSKIILNIGMGEAILNARAMENATRDLTLISGQRPITNRARKSIAGFKIREGMPIGVSVTMRGRRMYEFYDRLVSSSLPRIRDFQGVSREAFDGRGNFALGIREQVIFPEIDYNSIDRLRSLQVVIVTTAPTDREGLRLLELLGMPFTRPRDAVRAA